MGPVSTPLDRLFVFFLFNFLLLFGVNLCNYGTRLEELRCGSMEGGIVVVRVSNWVSEQTRPRLSRSILPRWTPIASSRPRPKPLPHHLRAFPTHEMEALPRKMEVLSLSSLPVYTPTELDFSIWRRLLLFIIQGRVCWISCRLWMIQRWNLLLKKHSNRSQTSPRQWKSSPCLRAWVRPPPPPFWLLTLPTLLRLCPTRYVFSLQFLLSS